MSEYVLARSETTQESGRGQQTDSSRAGDIISKRINGEAITTTRETPGLQTVTRNNPESIVDKTDTTPAYVATTTQLRPENTTTEKTYGHIGVQFSFTLQVTSIHPVDPAGGSGLVC